LPKLAAAPAVLIVSRRPVPRRRDRGIGSRIRIAISALTIATLGVLVPSAPSGTNATPPSVVLPVTSAAVRTDLRVGQPLDAAIAIAFTTPMNRVSVGGSLRVVPATSVNLSWDASGSVLTVRPTATWQPRTVHTITVDAGVLAANGAPMSSPVRAAFLTRAATSAAITVTRPLGARVAPDTAFAITFDRPVDAASVADALWFDPFVRGSISRIGRRGLVRYLFTPATPLAPNATYRLWLAASVRDAEGASIAPASLAFRTADAPTVIRFRPKDGTAGADRAVDVSVRFSEPMDRASTRAAARVTANGAAVAGTIQFADRDTVLVFHPAAPFRAGQTVVMTVAATARSAAGAPLGTAVSGTFTTQGGTGSSSGPRAAIPIPVGGTVGAGTWAAVEAYYLTLMNCTRTGGWVTSSGACSSPGGRSVAPLWIDQSISTKVSRPYAKLLATRGACTHFIGGTPGDRLRRAGYASWVWAENLGCPSGNPMRGALLVQLFFQSERPYNGGHYVNLMNAKYDRVGLGVWVYAGRVRVVIDFYHPL
jgi:uncharacterized protein YkwD